MTGGSIHRRALLAGPGLAAAAALGLSQGHSTTGVDSEHQDGITSAPLPFLSIAGFDVAGAQRADLITLLRNWTRIARDMAARATEPVTFTFGFGPSLFTGDAFGIAARRPSALAPLPGFTGESLDPAMGGGDICVQACSATPTAAHRAVRALVNAGRAHAALRWRQTGFRDGVGTRDPVGMFGFKDGTANLDGTDPTEAARYLWVDEGPDWLRGGTYLVVRRIRLLLDTWDRTVVSDQEAMIGRRRTSNLRFEAPSTAHTRLASHQVNNTKILRRSFTYDAGVDPSGLMDTGLIFISFQKSPEQFITIQERLSRNDQLNGFSQHLSSGVYACPPGVDRDSWIGEGLLT